MYHPCIRIFVLDDSQNTYSPWGSSDKGRRHSLDTSLLMPPCGISYSGGDHLSLAENLSVSEGEREDASSAHALHEKEHRKLQREPGISPESWMQPQGGAWNDQPSMGYDFQQRQTGGTTGGRSLCLDPRMLPPQISLAFAKPAYSTGYPMSGGDQFPMNHSPPCSESFSTHTPVHGTQSNPLPHHQSVNNQYSDSVHHLQQQDSRFRPFQAYPQHFQNRFHQQVHRNLSAPDSHVQSLQQHNRMLRQNSTSDPQLNCQIGETQCPPEVCQRQNIHRTSLPFVDPQCIWNPSPHVLVSRSSASLFSMTATTTSGSTHPQLQTTNSCGTSMQTQHPVLRQTSSGPWGGESSYNPYHQPNQAFNQLGPQYLQQPMQVQYKWRSPAEMPVNRSDSRYNLYFHLKSLFPDPDRRVEIVMNRYPDEDNPQKLCSMILSLSGSADII